MNNIQLDELLKKVNELTKVKDDFKDEVYKAKRQKIKL